MKRALIGFFSVIVVLITALLVGPGFFDWNQYKPHAIAAIKDKTGLEVVLDGDVKVALLPSPYAYVNNVSIKSPKPGRYKNIVTLGRLDLNLAFAPLLSGQVDFTAIELVKPAIYIETYADGSQNWQTDEITELMDGQKARGGDGQELGLKQGEQTSKVMSSISLKNVEITEGRFAFYNHKSQDEQVVENITADMRAETLSGPYTVEGSVRSASRAIKFKAKTGRLNGDASARPLNIEAEVNPDNIKIVYSGVIDTNNGLELQGETQLEINDLAEVVSNLGASSTIIKDVPFLAKGLLTANSENFAFMNSNITMANNRLIGSIRGQVNPLVLNLDLKSESVDLGSAFNIASASDVKKLAVSGRFAYSDEGVNAQDLNVRLDDTTLKGGVIYAAKSVQPSVKVVLKSEYLDLNKFIHSPDRPGTAGKSGAENAGKQVEQALRRINIPLNIEIDADIDKGQYGQYSFSGVRAKGAVIDKAVKVENISVQDFAGAELSADGVIGDYQSLNDIDVNISVKSKNIKHLAKALNIDTSGVPAGLKAFNGYMRSKGSAQSMDLTLNVQALQGDIKLSGAVSDVLGSIRMSDVDLQVKHPNFHQAMNAMQPELRGLNDLNKPLDFYAKISKNPDGYNMQDIRADISGIQASGNVALKLSGARPFVKGDLRLGDAIIGNRVAGGRHMPSSASSSSVQAQSQKKSVGWSNEAMDSGWMNALDLDVNLVATSINYQGWAMNKPNIHVQLQDGSLDLNHLQAGLYDGVLNLKGSMKAGNDNKGYDIKGVANLRDVSLEPLVGSLTGNRILTGKGLVSTDSTISANGPSPAALVNSLSGKGGVVGREMLLTGFDLARFARAMSSETKPGDTVLGVWKSTTNGGSTQFDTMDGEFSISEGIVNISSLKMDGPKAYISTTGKINIPQFTVETTHDITVKDQDIPEFSINISGPLNNPAQTFGQGVLNDYIARKVNRKLQDILSDKFGLPKAQNDNPSSASGSGGQSGAIDDDGQGGNTSNAPNKDMDQKRQIEPEEAIKGLLQGLLR